MSIPISEILSNETHAIEASIKMAEAYIQKGQCKQALDVLGRAPRMVGMMQGDVMRLPGAQRAPYNWKLDHYDETMEKMRSTFLSRCCAGGLKGHGRRLKKTTKK